MDKLKSLPYNIYVKRKKKTNWPRRQLVKSLGFHPNTAGA